MSRVMGGNTHLPLVGNGAIAARGESRSRCGTDIALPLSGRWCQDASPSLAIGQATIGSDAVFPFRKAVVANTVLAVRELADRSAGAAVDFDVETAVREE